MKRLPTGTYSYTLNYSIQQHGITKCIWSISICVCYKIRLMRSDETHTAWYQAQQKLTGLGPTMHHSLCYGRGKSTNPFHRINNHMLVLSTVKSRIKSRVF